jgi:hypothetical protein
MAGEEGLEPPNARTKTWCLTTWPLPNVYKIVPAMCNGNTKVLLDNLCDYTVFSLFIKEVAQSLLMVRTRGDRKFSFNYFISLAVYNK